MLSRLEDYPFILVKIYLNIFEMAQIYVKNLQILVHFSIQQLGSTTTVTTELF